MGDAANRPPGIGFSDTVAAPTRDALIGLAGATPHLDLRSLRVGYGTTEVIHGIDLIVGRGQSLCLVGPNGAGKSTILNGIFGLAEVFSGHAYVGSRNVCGMSARKLISEIGISYVLQSSSVFPDMTIEENLFMGGYLLPDRQSTAAAVEQIFDTHPEIAARRTEPAGALSGGERRMLELSRALMTGPEILLVDEPSIGLEPRAIDSVFRMLRRLQQDSGVTIIIVEQNARTGLEFADIGYVLASGRVALADRAAGMLENPQVGRMLLGA